MKNILLAAALSFAFAISASAAKKPSHGEGTPERGSGTTGPACPSYDCNDEPDRGPDGKHQETYEEGNDPSDDGYIGDDGGGAGGMIGELFYTQPQKTYPVKTNVKKEDRGATIVYTTITQEDISASETCTTIVTTEVEKKSGKVLSTDTKEYCNVWPL